MWGDVSRGHIEVNVPLRVALRVDFPDRFVREVVQATDSGPAEMKVLHVGPIEALARIGGEPVNVVEVISEAPAEVTKAIEAQAADPDTQLAGNLLSAFPVSSDEPSSITLGHAPQRRQTRQAQAPAHYVAGNGDPTTLRHALRSGSAAGMLRRAPRSP